MLKVLRFRSWNTHGDDLDEMTRFYRDVLGAELRTTHTVAGVKVSRMQVGGIGLGLFDASKERVAGVPHHTFEIEGPSDPEVLLKELESKGVKVDGVRRHGNGPGYSVYVVDPSGNRLELSTGSG
jgi:catechol 2,3-dioxygenase-like lactoylglutathione lyase family enzyme